MNELEKHIAKIQNSATTDPRFKNNEEVSVSKEDADYINRLFNSILPHFPAWRQTCPTDDDLKRLKIAWSKAFKRRMSKTGKKLDIKAGLISCEESESDWLPSVGKFIKWCEQSNDIMPFAQRALDLFNSAQKQIDSVGLMVTSKHGFDLKQMKALDTNKKFIELYLLYAEDSKIEPLEQALLTEEVQLTTEQQKEADKRNETAKNECLNDLFSMFGKPHEKENAKEPVGNGSEIGVKQGSLKTYTKTPRQLEEEKKRQLRLIQERLKNE